MQLQWMKKLINLQDCRLNQKFSKQLYGQEKYKGKQKKHLMPKNLNKKKLI